MKVRVRDLVPLQATVGRPEFDGVPSSLTVGDWEYWLGGGKYPAPPVGAWKAK